MAAELLARQPDLDCIYFSNDDLAFGGLCHCVAAGIDVPQDLALAGFNGLSLLEGLPGKIATSRTARREIGEAAVSIILDRLANRDDPAKRTRILEPRIDLGDVQARVKDRS
ncbi:substrate-binding domain-containing protein [Sulfitobacter geojensis]|uniref:substrate-binding domain-containing protein n=1 Tax=Sulfitobacter geojensis TaxID=1342299 RepID=UPI000699834A|nr:substrate-binding domain-containing protein [Sulfitobacter geojensis]KHA54070.1 Transcriptional regulator, LacI family [Sulfitobacter geojensis]NYI29888.1 LacI family gluconate utilization system Gnt-I transcriptional repressor [Sulfitobacter geojensis]